MPDSDLVIDEHTLAAFIAGTLPSHRREEVIAYLAGNSDAREVLQMAYEALEAAQDVEQSGAIRSHAKDRPAAAHRSDRAAVKTRALRGAGRYVAATVIVFAIGIVLRLAFGPPTDALRSPLPRDAETVRLQVDVLTGPAFAWSEVENAYHYRIVVWDPVEARVVGQYETRASELTTDDPILEELSDELRSGGTYTLRVDAVDARNRLIRSSETIEFTAP